MAKSRVVFCLFSPYKFGGIRLLFVVGDSSEE